MRPIRTNALIIIGLLVGTLALYGETRHFDFINFDDNAYVYENAHVVGGLSSASVSWSLTTIFLSNYHPLTWLSYILDVQLFGVNPGLMHVENAAWHAANSVLLFLLLLRMTHARWPSVWVAAMFACHPLHVESVAWIGERKDVLSTFFWFLATLIYVQWTKGRSPRSYYFSLTCLILGLLVKPMLVTLPFTLLLLDFWPLRRVESWGALVREKGWMFIAVIGSAAATFIAQSAGHSVASVHKFPIPLRLSNATISIAVYLRPMVWPAKLAIFYPVNLIGADQHLPAAPVAISAFVLMSLVVLLISSRRRWPWIAVGLLWFLGTLVPVIGIIQAGSQAHADRYTYIPLIGIFIAIAWSARAIVSQAHWTRIPTGIVAVATIAAAGTTAARQIGYWRDSITVMQHAADVVANNDVAHASLGEAMDSRGEHLKAAAEYREAIRLNPANAVAIYDLAVQSLIAGDDDQAIRLLRQALWADPSYGPAYNNYGNLLLKKGRSDDAIAVYRRGIQRSPSTPQIYHNLALTLAGEEKFDEAIPLWRQALAIDPDYADAHAALGKALLMVNQPQEGINHLRDAMRLKPGQIDARTTLAWTLATHTSPLYQDGREAETLAGQAVKLTGGADAIALDALAAAEARQGKFDDAIASAGKARSIAQQQGNADLVKNIDRRLALFARHQPFTSGK